MIDDAGKPAFGFCKYIYDAWGYYNHFKVFRYVEDNGITILNSGVFSQASKMSEGSAWVKEGEEGCYIDLI